MQKIKVGDKVIVIAGTHKGETGAVKAIDFKKNRIQVEKLAIRKKHQKRSQNDEGGIVSIEGTIALSNVMIYNEKNKAPDKVKIVYNKTNKVRYYKKTNSQIK
ncbi:50S ribosomal protein L24 [Mycoplasma sp. SG1]|uniref:50S ribosomal protein L24 n=1 Tax=Mycoplasma sp. SG1 TaxID=2810348 RepID=UPI002023FBD0|nr:50S ribosomal protein L24 [Mycoplasma sp. SG1]URM52902.1 50S ribosomal protein L24 [Mycoplasma sp. SG1]